MTPAVAKGGATSSGAAVISSAPVTTPVVVKGGATSSGAAAISSASVVTPVVAKRGATSSGAAAISSGSAATPVVAKTGATSSGAAAIPFGPPLIPAVPIPLAAKGVVTSSGSVRLNSSSGKKKRPLEMTEKSLTDSSSCSDSVCMILKLIFFNSNFHCRKRCFKKEHYQNYQNFINMLQILKD